MDLSSIIKYPVNVVMYYLSICTTIYTLPGMCILVVELYVNIFLITIFDSTLITGLCVK